MRTNHLFASAAVGAVLIMTGPAQAQILGAGARGAAGGALAGSFGSFSGMGTAHGRMSADTDPSLRGSAHAQRMADEDARKASKVSARASGATATAIDAGRDRSEAVAQGTITSGAREAHKTGALAGSAAAEAQSKATFVGHNGEAVAGESSNARPVSRSGESTGSNARTPARGGGSTTQGAGDVRDTSGSRRTEPPRKVAPEADASASGDASVNVTTAQ